VVRLFAACLVAALSVGSLAQAHPERSPQAGSPAIQIDVPDGWTVERSAKDALAATPADGSATVMAMVMTGAGQTPTLPGLAETLAKGEGAQLLPGSAPAVIDGHDGVAFVSTITEPGKPPVKIQTVLVVVDASHVAVCQVFISDGATPAQVQAIAAAVASAKILIGK
jgi:hypothetical protein